MFSVIKISRPPSTSLPKVILRQNNSNNHIPRKIHSNQSEIVAATSGNESSSRLFNSVVTLQLFRKMIIDCSGTYKTVSPTEAEAVRNDLGELLRKLIVRCDDKSSNKKRANITDGHFMLSDLSMIKSLCAALGLGTEYYQVGNGVNDKNNNRNITHVVSPFQIYFNDNNNNRNSKNNLEGNSTFVAPMAEDSSPPFISHICQSFLLHLGQVASIRPKVSLVFKTTINNNNNNKSSNNNNNNKAVSNSSLYLEPHQYVVASHLRAALKVFHRLHARYVLALLDRAGDASEDILGGTSDATRLAARAEIAAATTALPGLWGAIVECLGHEAKSHMKGVAVVVAPTTTTMPPESMAVKENNQQGQQHRGGSNKNNHNNNAWTHQENSSPVSAFQRSMDSAKSVVDFVSKIEQVLSRVNNSSNDYGLRNRRAFISSTFRSSSCRLTLLKNLDVLMLCSSVSSNCKNDHNKMNRLQHSMTLEQHRMTQTKNIYAALTHVVTSDLSLLSSPRTNATIHSGLQSSLVIEFDLVASLLASRSRYLITLSQEIQKQQQNSPTMSNNPENVALLDEELKAIEACEELFLASLPQLPMLLTNSKNTNNPQQQDGENNDDVASTAVTFLVNANLFLDSIVNMIEYSPEIILASSSASPMIEPTTTGICLLFPYVFNPIITALSSTISSGIRNITKNNNNNNNNGEAENTKMDFFTKLVLPLVTELIGRVLLVVEVFLSHGSLQPALDIFAIWSELMMMVDEQSALLTKDQNNSGNRDEKERLKKKHDGKARVVPLTQRLPLPLLETLLLASKSCGESNKGSNGHIHSLLVRLYRKRQYHDLMTSSSSDSEANNNDTLLLRRHHRGQRRKYDTRRETKSQDEVESKFVIDIKNRNSKAVPLLNNRGDANDHVGKNNMTSYNAMMMYKFSFKKTTLKMMEEELGLLVAPGGQIVYCNNNIRNRRTEEDEEEKNSVKKRSVFGDF